MRQGETARRRRLGTVRLALIAFLVATAIVPIAWASHLFTDVPDSNPFHADIGAVHDAGITAGKTCTTPGTPPTYCPQESITREAMAAFVHRGFGRVANVVGGVTVLPAGLNGVTLATATISVGGAPGRTQAVLVTGVVTSSITSLAGCPCTAVFFVGEVGDPDLDGTINSSVTHSELDPVLGAGYHTTRTTAVVDVPTGSTTTLEMVGVNVSGTGTVSAQGEITAMTAPFRG